jgi:hypothetical protein
MQALPFHFQQFQRVLGSTAFRQEINDLIFMQHWFYNDLDYNSSDFIEHLTRRDDDFLLRQSRFYSESFAASVFILWNFFTF